MARTKILSERIETSHPHLLRHDTWHTEGKMWNSWDVVRNRGAVLPRTPENPKNQGEQGTKIPNRPLMDERVDISPSD